MPPSAPLHAARYALDGIVHHGIVEGDHFARLDAAPWLGGSRTGDSDARERARLLAPCVPSKILCIGLNYRAHVAESLTVARDAGGHAEAPTEPLVFLKPPSAAIGPEEAIVYPAGVTRLDPEAELAIVVGRRGRRIRERDAMTYVAGVTCFNDVSARNYQKSDGQWARAKGFDTFAPFGPVIALGWDPADLAVTGRVNGVVRQHGRTSDLLFSIPRIVAHVSTFMTLEPGDVIATGTPAGIAPIAPGDRVEVEVEGVGVLHNPVVAEGP